MSSGSCIASISIGPLGSRAAKAIGFIEKMIEYSYVNAPLQKELLAGQISRPSVWVYLFCLFQNKLKKQLLLSSYNLKAPLPTRQMKLGTQQHSSCPRWRLQSLAQLSTLTMGSTQWDLHLTAQLYPHRRLSALELVQRTVDFAGNWVYCLH